MNINELVFVVLAVVNVISLMLIFIMYHHIISMKLHLTQAHTGLATVLGKILNVEMVLSRMSNGFTELINTTGDLLDRVDGPPSLYKTTDGKYVASSIDELINKMKNDKKDSEYFSDDEVDKLRKLFEPDDDIDDLDEPEDKY